MWLTRYEAPAWSPFHPGYRSSMCITLGARSVSRNISDCKKVAKLVFPDPALPSMMHMGWLLISSKEASLGASCLAARRRFSKFVDTSESLEFFNQHIGMLVKAIPESASSSHDVLITGNLGAQSSYVNVYGSEVWLFNSATF